ncbi:MAG TPA: hypothetical protein DD827_01530 [Gammaproteobacteria bacterium]|nr:hypothetical protein [Gammaproteobacteria bacterium]
MSANKTSMVNLTITSEGIGDKEKVSIQLSMPPFTSPEKMTARDGQEKAEKRGGVIHRKFEAIKPN